MNNLWGEVEGVRRSWGGSCVQVYTESLVWNSRMLSSQVARWELPRCSSGKAGCVLFTIWMRFQASLLRICSLLCTLALLLRLPPGHLAQALLQSVIVDSLEFAYANKCINRCKWEAKGRTLRVAWPRAPWSPEAQESTLCGIPFPNFTQCQETCCCKYFSSELPFWTLTILPGLSSVRWLEVPCQFRSALSHAQAVRLKWTFQDDQEYDQE